MLPCNRAIEYPCYHNRPSAPTNLTLHQTIELNSPICCGDVAVYPGDVIVEDQEGVVVIPLNLAKDISQEATEMTTFEDFVAEQVNAGKFIIGLCPATSEKAQAEYAKWRINTER